MVSNKHVTVALNFDNTGYNSLVSILSNDDEVNQGREMLEEAGLLHESSHYPNYYANFVISDIKVINKCKKHHKHAYREKLSRMKPFSLKGISEGKNFF